MSCAGDRLGVSKSMSQRERSNASLMLSFTTNITERIRMTQLKNRFHAAVRELAAAGPVKARLEQAWCGHLQGLAREDLPEELRAGFGRLAEALHRHSPVTGQSAVSASVRKLSEAEAGELAALVVELLVLACRSAAAAQAEQRLKVVGGSEAEADVPPALLVDRR